MKNLKSKTLAMMIIALMIGLNLNVDAQKQDNRGPGSCTKNIPDLTEDQEKKIEALKVAHMKKMQDFKNQMAEKQARLQTLRSADKPDMDAINKLIDEISDLQSTMMKSREKHIQDVRSLLTDEQRVYFDQHRRGHRGPGCCSGKGPGSGGRGSGNGPGNGGGPGSNCPYRGK